MTARTMSSSSLFELTLERPAVPTHLVARVYKAFVRSNLRFFAAKGQRGHEAWQK